MNKLATKIVPFSLKDAPSLIERVFPSMKVSAEAQKERKAGPGQTLTALGSYWKGRKPLVLVRACILGCLLPATSNVEQDLQIFEILMGMDDASVRARQKKKGDPLRADSTYDAQIAKAYRLEELESDIVGDRWKLVNEHLGTTAGSIQDLVRQLGTMRFGHSPVVADTFSGGGSIPFEAGRLGCDAFASDLNPVACMLTWGALNLIGNEADLSSTFHDVQTAMIAELDKFVQDLGIERDSKGNVAKAYFYCLETRCPDTGWLVPMLSSRVISGRRKGIIDLIPLPKKRTYDFQYRENVSDEELLAAATGTISNGRLVHAMNSNLDGVAISTIRGDHKDADGNRSNALRKWGKADFRPAEDDIFRERLYCVQWIAAETGESGRSETFFAAPTTADLGREDLVNSYVAKHLSDWQKRGLVPDMLIEPGEKTDEPIRTRGWTYWHHLFSARHLLILSKLNDLSRNDAYATIAFASVLDFFSKLTRWVNSGRENGGTEFTTNVFSNQALNTFFSRGEASSKKIESSFRLNTKHFPISATKTVASTSVRDLKGINDIYITDPPYADAVNYHEIYEFFIAWLRKKPPAPFDAWQWDSRRRLAIKGKGEEFRASMVDAYKVMTDHMPDNGIQIVMFTHQDGKVWSDMAQIFWGAGLQVLADWYIATETTSELKKGGYVQGTHIIVLRKRAGSESGYSDEITQEVKEEVARQIEEMVGLNQSLKGHGRSENLFNDADLQMAGYAAALRVLTKYVKIDGKDMTVEAMRPRGKTERTNIDEIIEYAVQVANEHLVPEGMTAHTWRRLNGSERFYLKMMDIETTGAKKIDNYQNFAKAFRVIDYGTLMSSVSANNASLKSAAELGKRQMGDDEFGSSLTRAVLYGLWEMGKKVEEDVVLEHVRDLASDYLDQRGDLVTIANYIADKRKDADRKESQNAEILARLIKNQRIG